jgi:hypothetical protein
MKIKIAMSLPKHSPNVLESDVFWTKEDEKIDISGSGGKYTVGNIPDLSLTITALNPTDEGKYQCCVSNSLGEMRSEAIRLGKVELSCHLI